MWQHFPKHLTKHFRSSLNIGTFLPKPFKIFQKKGSIFKILQLSLKHGSISVSISASPKIWQMLPKHNIMSSYIAQSSQTRICLWNQSSIWISFMIFLKILTFLQALHHLVFFSKHGCIFQNMTPFFSNRIVFCTIEQNFSNIGIIAPHMTALKKKAASAIMWQDLPKHDSISQKRQLIPELVSRYFKPKLTVLVRTPCNLESRP